MMEKFWSLVDIYYQLQNNDILLLSRLSNGHTFLDSNFNKVLSPMNLSYFYFLISLYNVWI